MEQRKQGTNDALNMKLELPLGGKEEEDEKDGK